MTNKSYLTWRDRTGAGTPVEVRASSAPEAARLYVERTFVLSDPVRRVDVLVRDERSTWLVGVDLEIEVTLWPHSVRRLR